MVRVQSRARPGIILGSAGGGRRLRFTHGWRCPGDDVRGEPLPATAGAVVLAPVSASR